MQGLCLSSFLASQRLPILSYGHSNIRVLWLLEILVSHFHEEKLSQLLKIVAITHAVLAQVSTETTDPGDDC